MQARKIIEWLHKPWYITPGNHDSKWSESGNNSFVTTFGSERFSFEKNGYLFIGTASGPNMRMGPGLVPREQIVFLDSVLKSRKNADQSVIFVNHYPLNESLSNWYDITDRLHSVNIKATLLGHGHANRLYNFEGIPGIMGRSNLQTKKVKVGYNLVTIQQDTIFYAERLSSGKTLPVWCKVPIGVNPRGNHPSGNINVTVLSTSFPRPDYSMNQKYPNIRTIWNIQEMSDIGAGISAYKNRAVYANTAGDIVAVDLHSGAKIWNYHTGGKIYATPAIEGNRVVCASTDHNIYCLNLKSGKLIWMHPTVKPIVASPAIEANSVYIGSSDGSFRCLNLSDGKLVWKFDSVENFVECKPLILKNSVSFGSWGNTYYSLDKKTGKEIWDSGKYSCRESIWISANSNLVFIKNMTEGNIDAFFTTTANQELAWECKADLGYEIAPSPLVESGKFLYVPTATGVVVAINTKTHQVAWKHKICNALINSVLPIGKGRILVSTMDGQVVCLSVN
jgi:outer membrane protein assembly factor BamB